MNILLPLIILIILAVIYAGSLNNPRNRLYVVIGILALILFICWFHYKAEMHVLELFLSQQQQNNNNITSNIKIHTNCLPNPDHINDHLNNYVTLNEKLAPFGTYDGVVLPNNMKTAPLMKNVFITSPVGDDILLTHDPVSDTFPSVDGTPNGEKHLFMFAHNNFGKGCHSQYSTDRGMVCHSNEQLKMFKN